MFPPISKSIRVDGSLGIRDEGIGVINEVLELADVGTRLVLVKVASAVVYHIVRDNTEPVCTQFSVKTNVTSLVTAAAVHVEHNTTERLLFGWKKRNLLEGLTPSVVESAFIPTKAKWNVRGRIRKLDT